MTVGERLRGCGGGGDAYDWGMFLHHVEELAEITVLTRLRGRGCDRSRAHASVPTSVCRGGSGGGGDGRGRGNVVILLMLRLGLRLRRHAVHFEVDAGVVHGLYLDCGRWRRRRQDRRGSLGRRRHHTFPNFFFFFFRLLIVSFWVCGREVSYFLPFWERVRDGNGNTQCKMYLKYWCWCRYGW